MAARIGTNEVSNQSPPFQDVDLFGSDTPLREAVAANGAGDDPASLAEFGRRWGSAAMFERAKLANENPPRLEGEVVEFHPAYHHFMAESVREGLHASTWQPDGTPAAAPAEVARAARF
jgi:putative acyl-CoA dehydrogenase